MVGFKTIWLLIMFVVLGACVPQEKQAGCGSNKSYNATLRSCISSAALAGNNRPLAGADQAISTAEDTPVAIILNAATDIDGNNLFYFAVTNPASGSLSNCMNKSGSSGLTDLTCTYTPSANFNGTDSFTYKINDGYQDSSTFATVTITVTSVDDAPVVTAHTPFLVEDVPYTYTFYYTDTESDLANSCSTSSLVNVSAGACSCSGLGVCTVLITPSLNANSSNTVFSFDIDVTAGLSSATVTETVTVTPVNDVPVISTLADCSSSNPLAQNTASTCVAPIVTDPDTADLPAQTHTWALTAANTCSWMSINSSTGIISGTPDNSKVGSCNFVYKVTDSASSSVTATTIPMVVTNVAPVLSNVAAATIPVEDAGSQLIGLVSSSPGCTDMVCVANDILNQGTLSFGAGTTCSANGTLAFTTVNANTSQIRFTPSANYASGATCDIDVEFNDGHSGIDNSLISITVSEINDNPTLNVTTIPNQTTNEATPFIVDSNIATTTIEPLIIDAGGGADENGQSLVVKVQSSNTTLVPHTSTNFRMYSDSAFAIPYGFVSANVSGVTYSATDGDVENLYLSIQPAAGQTGSATITVTLTDNGTTAAVLAPKITTKTFTLNVTNKAAVHNDWTNIYAVGAKVLHDGVVAENPSVELAWNSFTAFNDTISGYQVYRSTSINGPWLTPVNPSVISTSLRTFTDTTLTDADAGTTFYYRVMGVSTANGKNLDTTSTYSSLRVPIPLHNMALVSRRMTNKSNCAAMGKTSDKFNNHRCAYIGAGAISGYSDLGNDYFVDRYEASCNYTVAECPESGGAGCIGSVPPAGVYTAANNSIYYDRSSGTCYLRSAGSWVTVANLTSAQLDTFADYNQKTQEVVVQDMASTFPKRPPLVRIQQFKANNYCASGSINPAYGVVNKKLMNRKVHFAAAEWSPSLSSVDATEEGASVSLVTSQCNSSNGGNLTYQDGLLSALYDTWTTTEVASTSSHSFVMAGSDVTNACQSRYGIQDLAGNVEEWNSDRIFSLGGFLELYPLGINTNTYGASYASFVLDPTFNMYSFVSTPTDTQVDDSFLITAQPALLDYAWSTGFDIFDHVYYPLGYPTFSPSLAPVSSREGIPNTSVTFNNDKVFQTGIFIGDSDLTVEDGELLGLTSGGHFADGSAAGRFTLRYRTVCHDGDSDGACAGGGDVLASGTEENVYTGFRCMIPIP